MQTFDHEESLCDVLDLGRCLVTKRNKVPVDALAVPLELCFTWGYFNVSLYTRL